ncbi:hypothetical protein D3C72_2062060 [compost metagenome]
MARASSGQVSVVAKPEINVMPVIARPARSAYSAPRVANKASYSPIAMPVPMITQANMNTCRLWQFATISRPIPTTAPLPASCTRPPWRATSRLESGASNAETINPSDSAP